MSSSSFKRKLENCDGYGNEDGRGTRTQVAELSSEGGAGPSCVKNGHVEFRNVILSINASQEKDVALHFLTQLQELMANVANYADIDQILDLIFDDKVGVVRFLKSRIGQKPFDEPKEVAMSSIKNLLGNKAVDSSLVVKHCIKLKDAINCIWRSARESARLQTAAAQCLVTLIENYGGLISAFDFDASDLYRSLLLSSEKSAFQPSVRGEMLQLLGLIAYIFKDQVFRKDTRDQLMLYLMKCIKNQVDSAQKQLEASILQGSIRGMDFFLRAYGKEYNGQVELLEEMFQKIINPKISITFDNTDGRSTKKVKRREFQRGVLTLIEHNAVLFQQPLFRKYQLWFEDFITWCKSTYREDYDRAKLALMSFLRVVCDCLLQTELDADSAIFKANVVNYMVAELVRIFENNEMDSPISEVSVDSILLITTAIPLDPNLKNELEPKLFARLEKCITEIQKAERGPGYVEELSTDEAEALLPNLTADGSVDFKETLSRVTDEKLGSLVTRLIQSLSENETLCERHAPSLVNAIISVWDRIESNFESDFVLRTLSGMVLLHEESAANSEYLCKWWIETMNSKRKKLQEKMLFVEFLRLFGLSSNAKVRKMIWENLEVINERLLEQDSEAFLMMQILEEVIVLCRGYPDSMELLISFSRFFFTLSTSIQQYHTELKDECVPGCHHYAGLLKTREVFERYVQNVQNSEEIGTQEAGFLLSQSIYKMIKNGNPAPASLLYKFCLHPCLSNLQKKYLETFAKDNIFSILTAATVKGSTENDFLSKTTALCIYEVIALSSHRDFLRVTLHEKYVRHLPVPPTKPAEVVRVIVEIWKNIKANPFIADSTNKRTRKIQYDFNAAAFNAVATTLVTSKYPENLIQGLLLEDYEGNRVWEKIVDAEMELFFPITKEATSELELEHSSQDGAESSRTNQRYKRSRFEATRRVSTDAGRFDFTGGYSRSNSHSQEHGGVLLPPTKKGGYFLLQSHISLERITQLVCYLKSLEVKSTTTMPLWMKALLNKFTTQNVPVNVKLFLCALVVNSQNTFKPYGDEFMKSIILVITSGSIQNHPTENSTSLNSFERELIQMLLDWNITPTPTATSSTELSPTEELFNYCSRKVLYRKKEVQQLNLELLTQVVSAWIKPKFSAKSHEVILNLFELEDKTLGLLVVIAVLKAGILPCDEMDLRTFIGTVGQFLASSSMQYYELAAEGLGLILKVCRDLDVGHFSRIVQHARRFFITEKGRAQPFIMMLKAVALNYPAILDSFQSEIEHLLEHKPEVQRDATALLQIVQREQDREMIALDESQSQLNPGSGVTDMELD